MYTKRFVLAQSLDENKGMGRFFTQNDEICLVLVCFTIPKGAVGKGGGGCASMRTGGTNNVKGSYICAKNWVLCTFNNSRKRSFGLCGLFTLKSLFDLNNKWL